MKKKYYNVDKALRSNDIKTIKRLVKDKSNDLAYEGNFPLFYASEYNLVEIFQILIKQPQVRRKKIDVEGFSTAMFFGNNEILELYLEEKTLKKFQEELKKNISDYFIDCCLMVVEELESQREIGMKKQELDNTINKYKKVFDIVLNNFDKKEILNKFREKDKKAYSNYKSFFCFEEMIRDF